MTSAAIATHTPHKNDRFDVVISIPSRPLSEATSAPAIAVKQVDDDGDEKDDDDELSDETVDRLLREAAERMRNGEASSVSTAHAIENASTIRFPKLDPGSSLPKAHITSKGAVSQISDPLKLVSDSDRALANSERPVGQGTNKKSKNGPPPTAGSAWFDLPRTELTTEFKRDFALIKARNVLDPHRHYKKDNSGIPEYSQMGTIIEGNTEFFNSRINRKDRKKTILEEVLADGTSRDRFKRKYSEIQQGKKSGKKDFYKKLKEQRKKFKFTE